MFPTKDASRVITCIVMVTWLGPASTPVKAQFSCKKGLLLLAPTSSEAFEAFGFDVTLKNA